jgi:SinI restriction endonuclease
MTLLELATHSAGEIDSVLDASHKNDFLIILDFLDSHLELRPRYLKGKKITAHMVQDFASKFKKSRLSEFKNTNRKPTKIDPLVGLIYSKRMSESGAQSLRALEAHQVLMSIENKVGHILERYIQSVIKKNGWVWCSGSTVKHVDFIQKKNGVWRSLQVKNRDNSENSASSLVRSGTAIEKWHRFMSRTGETNWQSFPDIKMRSELSESGFHKFVLSQEL